MDEEKALNGPECYLNTQTGDLYIIWYICNRPSGNNWVQISKKCYDVITENLFDKKKEI